MSLFIGLMSGTSMDGVDAALARIDADGIATLGAAFLAFPPALRAELMALQAAGSNEVEREALAANGLARVYADCVALLLEQSGQRRDAICAVAVHGQTIRHRPELGFTRQTNNPALLAELCGINVIADFRSRDVAAGGQGAPLVPAFHHALFSHPAQTRVVANIGGIANISILPGAARMRALALVRAQAAPCAASTRAPATPCSTAGYSAIWGANMISTAPGAPLAS
jgi:anhydro-N-acetylmuramic acid kinase